MNPFSNQQSNMLLWSQECERNNYERDENMNTKNTAIITIAMMLAVALTGAVLVQDVDAADSETISNPELGNKSVTVYKGGDPAIILLQVSEMEYLPLGYTLVWYAATASNDSGNYSATFEANNTIGDRAEGSEGSEGVFTPRSPITIDDFYVSIAESENLGYYLLKIEATDSVSASGTASSIAIKCSVSVGLESNEYYDVPPIYGVLNVTCNEASQAIPLDSMSVPLNIPFEKEIDIGSDVSFTTAGKSWFAVGLPAGLSMSPDGIISGMMTEYNSSTVKVYATAANGSISEYSLNISKKTIDGDVVIKLSSENNSNLLVKHNSMYTVGESVDDLKLTVSLSESNSESTLDVVGVRLINEGGVTLKLDYPDDGVPIPTNGIGEYSIAVSYILDDGPMTEYVKLQVISDLDALEASIVINGA